MRPLLSALLFLCASAALATDYPIPAGQFADIRYKVESGDKVVIAVSPAPVQRADGLEPGRFIFAGKAGTTYTVRGFIVNFKAERLVPIDDTVTFGGAVPPGPTPPGPNPPAPPEPTPDPAPIPADGLRVLFVFEADDLSKYPRGQVNAMYAKGVADYLAAKCVKGADGKTPETRAYDQHTPMDAAPKLWRDAMARPRSSLPWLVVSNGKTGFEGPVPYNPADPADLNPILTLLKKYGGN